MHGHEPLRHGATRQTIVVCEHSGGLRVSSRCLATRVRRFRHVMRPMVNERRADTVDGMTPARCWDAPRTERALIVTVSVYPPLARFPTKEEESSEVAVSIPWPKPCYTKRLPLHTRQSPRNSRLSDGFVSYGKQSETKINAPSTLQTPMKRCSICSV
jgi:hypothetical protein